LRGELKGEISTKFVLISTYKDEEETLKAKPIPYHPNSNPSFNPKKVQRQTIDSSMPNFDGVYAVWAIWISFTFVVRELRRDVLIMLETHHDEFLDLSPHSYSRVPHRSYSRASSRTSACDFPQFSYGHNHRSYDFSP
jgi:hypothetical protein